MGCVKLNWRSLFVFELSVIGVGGMVIILGGGG